MKLGKKEEADKSILFSKPINLKQDFSGKVPNLLIGSYNYPRVNVGTLVSEEYTDQDEPQLFVKNKTTKEDIVHKRQELINSRVQLHIKSKHSHLEKVRELAQSKIATTSEVSLLKPLKMDMSFFERAAPHGPTGQLRKLDITENTKIPKRIDQLSEEQSVTAASALQELQQKQFDSYYLTKIFSVGTLGRADARKLVPTKWSITAVDDHLGNNLRDTILDYPEITTSIVCGNYLGNYYIIVVQSGAWSFELIEYVMPKTIHNSDHQPLLCHDYEYQQGRKNYAEHTAGGYYASRLPWLEYFIKEKKQGAITIFRVITPEYDVPLGVWVVREGVRTAISDQRNWDRIDQSEIKQKVKEKLAQFNLSHVDEFINTSVLLKGQQKSLNKWFN